MSRMLWSGVGVLALASAAALAWAAAAPGLWEEAKSGVLIGRKLESWWMPLGDERPNRYVPGWTRTYTRVVDLNVERVVAVQTDDKGVIVGCAAYLVNFDAPEHPLINVKAAWGRGPAGAPR